MNSLDIIPNQPTKFTTKNWVEINDDVHGAYNFNAIVTFMWL